MRGVVFRQACRGWSHGVSGFLGFRGFGVLGYSGSWVLGFGVLGRERCGKIRLGFRNLKPGIRIGQPEFPIHETKTSNCMFKTPLI